MFGRPGGLARRGVSFWAGPARRACQAIYVAGFSVGVVVHARDLLTNGRPRGAPLAFDVYWTSLTALDALAVALLFLRPRAGVWLAIAIMLSDVAVNSYAAATFLRGAFQLPALALQAVFLAFVLVTAPWLLRAEQGGFSPRRGNAWRRRRGGLGRARGPFSG